ncbi:MAG: copper homeostasis membrane protein CopD [Roseiarcus sp.]|jgi:putative copper resistance protein D
MLTALVICRLSHFAATMLLFGASVFLWALVPAGLARELAGPVRRMIAAAIVVAAVSALAWLALEAGLMSEGWAETVDPSDVGAVAFDTAFGRVWLGRIGLTLVLAAGLTIGRRDRFGFIALTAALLLASLGLVGHATIQTGLLGALHRLNHAVHLLAAGAWLGGLPPLVLCLRRHDGEARLRAEAAATLRRFSGLGHFVVALVVLTGVANTALTLGVWPTDFSSPYQTLLAAKIAIVAAMIGIALFNRYVLTPRIKTEPAAALRALTIASLAEVALGLVALALVSVFAILAPV